MTATRRKEGVGTGGESAGCAARGARGAGLCFPPSAPRQRAGDACRAASSCLEAWGLCSFRSAFPGGPWTCAAKTEQSPEPASVFEGLPETWPFVSRQLTDLGASPWLSETEEAWLLRAVGLYEKSQVQESVYEVSVL